MTDIFVDTSFFKAQIDEKDDFHVQAVSILKKLKEENAFLITTNYILDETYTLIRVKRTLELVRDFVNGLKTMESGLRIEQVLTRDESEAWSWFWNKWSKLSFTDCVSFAVMKRLGLARVATFDDHFSQAGFTVEKAK